MRDHWGKAFSSSDWKHCRYLSWTPKGSDAKCEGRESERSARATRHPIKTLGPPATAAPHLCNRQEEWIDRKAHKAAKHELQIRCCLMFIHSEQPHLVEKRRQMAMLPLLSDCQTILLNLPFGVWLQLLIVDQVEV